MPAPVPIWLTVVFVALVLGLATLVLVAVALRRGGGAAAVTSLALDGWLGVTAVLAAAGLFEDFSRIPPRLVFALAPPLLAILWLCRSAAVGRLLDEIPPGWLVYPQSFRIVMELILWELFVVGAIPAIMTFEGRNADILVGLTAPLIAWQCFARRAWSVRAAVWWNVAGILILLNVVVHAQLSAPTPFRVFMTQPPVTFIAYVPWIWLPAFLVPLAWALHALSIRQVLRRAAALPGASRTRTSPAGPPA
jgi:hypothetical protein